MPRPALARDLARDLARTVDRRRGLLAGGLAAASVAAGLQVLAPAAPPVVQVVAAARDLPGGVPLTADDLLLVELPAEAAPAGTAPVVEQLAGRVLAGPVRAGEPLTDVRLLGAGLVPDDGRVAVPVRVVEPALPLLVRAGDRVDVLAAAPEGGDSARAVVSDVAVLAVPDAVDTVEGALLVVAAPPSAAARLAAAAVSSRLSVVVRGRS
ncbi:MAG TPA: SAF domain-containing protein [Mycobacteriales bacterium]|nr:SAF domain-containing protein [Mycobacteriales bacterium]